MANPNLETLLAAATAYDEFFVPALFQQWAPLVAAAAQLLPGQRVLDVACGTGVLSREVAARVGGAGFGRRAGSESWDVGCGEPTESRNHLAGGNSRSTPLPGCLFRRRRQSVWPDALWRSAWRAWRDAAGFATRRPFGGGGLG